MAGSVFVTTTELLERTETVVPDHPIVPTSMLSPVAAPLTLDTPSTLGAPEARRLRSARQFGPRCPDCGGPLVHGEGCRLCPICGHSSCG
jgi:hypothetical protein